MAEWENLGTSTQTDWNDLAAATFGWPLQGSPRYMDGETYFANYYTVILLLDEYAPVPDVPSGGPIWQDKPKFWEFATWESGVYTLSAETDFDVDSVLLFSGLPPSKVGFKPEFAREVFIGNDQLYGGLFPDETYDGVHYMMENTFGTIDSTMKIWGRIWEVQDGYIRTLKDPCTPDPTDTPPPTTGLAFELYNDYTELAIYGDITLIDDDWTQVGFGSVENIDPDTTAYGTAEFDEGYGIDDVAAVWISAEWDDYRSMFEETPYYDTDPFQYTIFPSF